MSSVPIPRRSTGRVLLLIGLVVSFAGLAAYVVQILMQRLHAPWYMPISGTLGFGLVLASLWRKRTVWRILALLFVLLLGGAEWTMLLATRLPAYAGPIAIGKAFPAFATLRADGSRFTQNDLVGDKNTVIVSFRGRW